MKIGKSGLGVQWLTVKFWCLQFLFLQFGLFVLLSPGHGAAVVGGVVVAEIGGVAVPVVHG